MLTIAIACLVAYLLGSISSAVLVCKIMRLPDPRTKGSQNPGATNVLRIGGKKAAALTLIGDTLKGLVPVLLALAYGLSSMALAFVALSAFIGHIFPIFFKFEGGKGVATALGCLIGLNWPSALCWIGTWGFTALLFRYSSLAALMASILTPFYVSYFTHDTFLTAAVAFMSVILIFRHRTNIAKLMSGKESKIGKK